MCPATVIPNGVDPEEFAQNSDAEIGFEPYVLAVGRLVPQKGFDVLLDAFAMIQLPGVNLVIAGDGFEREALARRAAHLGIVDRVHLLGTVERRRLSALMRGAEVFAFPSRGEPFGIAHSRQWRPGRLRYDDYRGRAGIRRARGERSSRPLGRRWGVRWGPCASYE